VLVLRRLLLQGIVCLLASLASAQQTPKVELQYSETLFSVITAMNSCGYDEGLGNSLPVREQVRKAVAAELAQSSAAASSTKEMCEFYREHKPADANRDLSQYVSLALNLGDAPDFKAKVKEADLPPDTHYVLGFIPLVARFYKDANLHEIWTGVQPTYAGLVEKFHNPVSNMILQTDVYLKNPISGFLGRRFVIYMEPMAGPGDVNARNYGDDYFLVTSPSGDQLSMQQVRHTYLHFTLDPLMLKRPAAMKRLAPLLKTVQSAPLEESFKTDITLLTTECLIRAIEARLEPGGKAADQKRERAVEEDMANGYVLTRYFYEALIKFEQEPTSLKDAFGDFLYYLDEGREEKRAAGIQFASKGLTEVVKGKPGAAHEQDPLDLAERKITEKDYPAAAKLAQDTIDKKGEDTPRAYLILGEIATLQKDKDTAIKYFEQTLRTAKDPRLIAWSHIYLGRIYDVDQERDIAVKHYEAALRAGDDTPQTKAAAQRGLQSAYERRASPEREQ
jgi:tetratricopeptide (TPR) repeat protein